MPDISVKNLNKSFQINGQTDQRLNVIDNISFELKAGEFVTVFGPNGCGKSTLVNILAGIIKFDSGIVSVGGKTPEEAKTGIVFQNYNDSLIPWLNCLENILLAYRFRIRRSEYDEAKLRLKKLIEKLRISLPLNNYPYQLSGGQKNLVAILRTLVYKPDVILFDEPFSALDYENRIILQKTLLSLWEEERITVIFISHDIEEAIFLANRVFILSRLPAKIKSIVEVNFPYPRERSLYHNNQFFNLRKHCLEIFKQNFE